MKAFPHYSYVNTYATSKVMNAKQEGVKGTGIVLGKYHSEDQNISDN